MIVLGACVAGGGGGGPGVALRRAGQRGHLRRPVRARQEVRARGVRVPLAGPLRGPGAAASLVLCAVVAPLSALAGVEDVGCWHRRSRLAQTGPERDAHRPLVRPKVILEWTECIMV